MDLEYGQQVGDELKQLVRSDRAAWDPRLAEQLHGLSHLRDVCGISEQDLNRLTPNSLRLRIRRALDRLLGGYPDELLTLDFATGLHPDARVRPYAARRRPLAALTNYEDRTIRRHIDKACQLFGSLAAAEHRKTSGGTTDVGYEVSELKATLNLEQRVVTDERKIHPNRDLLNEIVGRFSAPRSAGVDPQFDVEYGGTLLGSARRPGGLIEYRVRPPRPLRWNEAHSYGIRYTLSSDQDLADHFVVQPVRTSYEAVSLAVQFDPNRLPREVSRIDGLFPRQLEDQHPDRERLTLSPSGLVEAVFHGVHDGLAYGIGWAW